MSRKGGETRGSVGGRFALSVVESHPFAKSAKGWGRSNSTSSRECLSGFVALHAGMGSFGCVIVRVADDNFAQDDRWGGVVESHV